MVGTRTDQTRVADRSSGERLGLGGDRDRGGYRMGAAHRCLRGQVRVDGGRWQDAQLATEYSIDTWRQWKFTWQATRGEHTVECRAIDKNGTAQVEAVADPVPDGATGLDSRTYTVN